MKTKMMKLALNIAMPATLLALAACSSTPEPQAETTNPNAEYSPILTETGRGALVLDAEKAVFTVVGINASERTVMLRESDGTLLSCECGPEVRNFEQIKLGDQVTATVAASVAVGLLKGNDVPLGAQTTTAVVRSPMGAKPGGKIVDTVGFTAKVMKVDMDTRQLTLQKTDGETETVKVSPEIDLANINAGDHVGVRVTRAFAITVATPEK